MCRTSNFLPPPISAGSLGLSSSQIMGGFEFPSSINTTVQKRPSSSSTSSRKNKSQHPHIVVQHHYHDHANEEEFIDERPARGGVTTPFPIRLHKMLDKMAADGHEDVIHWQPHGRCFVVSKPKEFKELLPIYFKLSKMSSFQRQLNLYGFQRLTRGRDKNGYYHEYFLRGKPALSHKIQRTKVKGTGVRARSNPSTEPHLWEMSWVGTDSQPQQNHSDGGSVSSHEDHATKPSPVVSMPPLSSMPVPSSSFMPPLTRSTNDCFLVTPTTTPSLWSHQYVQQRSQEPEMQSVHQQASSSYSSYNPLPLVELEGQDTIMSFGGKSFHYLDPQEMMKEAELRKRQEEACKRDDMQSFMSNLELDNLYSQLDDELVDDDENFMEMLERVLE